MPSYITDEYKMFPVAPHDAGEIYVAVMRGDVPPGPVPPPIALAGGDRIYMGWLPPGCVIHEIVMKGIGGFSGALKMKSLTSPCLTPKPEVVLATLTAPNLGTDGNWHYDGRFRDWPAMIDMKQYAEIYIDITTPAGSSYILTMEYRTEQPEDKGVRWLEVKR